MQFKDQFHFFLVHGDPLGFKFLIHKDPMKTNLIFQVCSSEDTSCEWLPPDSSLLGGLILKEELEEELE